ncbi:hypothetical protein ACYULU_06170 [Breznakiellaceae bacterium SP9]
MKNIIRILSVSLLSFIVLFALLSIVKIIALWTQVLSTASFVIEQADIREVFVSSVSLTLYLSILYSLSFALRKRLLTFWALMRIGILSFCFTALAIGGLAAFKTEPEPISDFINQSKYKSVQVARSNTPSPDEQTVVSFHIESSHFLDGILSDAGAAGVRLLSLFEQDWTHCLLYIGSLVFLIISLQFILRLSTWPLANILAAACAYRGLLALENHLDTQPAKDYFVALFSNRVESDLISPCIFIILATIIILCTILVSMLRHRRINEA